MALTREQKETLVGDYESGFSVAQHVFLVSFSGVSVPQATDLRRRLREEGGHYRVVKNTLALRAVRGTPLEGMAEEFRGPVAVAYTDSDPVSLAKVLTEFAKEVPALDFRGGVVDGQKVAAAEVQTIASLPSREQLIAKLLFLLQSPIAGLVQGLGAIQQQFVSVLDQIRQKREAEGGG